MTQATNHMMLHFDGVTKLYGTVIGVNDISIDLEPGAYGLLGPNGSGKTTLLNLLTGQLRPTIGHVELFGESPTRTPSILGRIGLCPALEVLYRDVTAIEWVTLMLELQGYDSGQSRKRAEFALHKVGLGDAMNRAIQGYSRGMKQRTKLAQAVAHEPELLILDEPFTGLDPLGRHEMTELLQGWVDEGKSLILSSHILHEVEAVSQSFLLICGGRLLASGTAVEVHSLLENIPKEILIRSPDAKQIAQLAIEHEHVDSVQLAQSHLTMKTRHPLDFYQDLAKWIQAKGYEVEELTSGDDSLQSLFNTLMKVHRGEISHHD